MRPSNFRDRLREEGKPYPKSSCQACNQKIDCPWKGDREADCARLESEATLTGNEGSNPSPSAIENKFK